LGEQAASALIDPLSAKAQTGVDDRETAYALPEKVWRPSMCRRCEEIDAKIAHYKRLAQGINDKATIEHLLAFIVDLELEKSTLHPEAKK
jgi:hypothetical protein